MPCRKSIGREKKTVGAKERNTVERVVFQDFAGTLLVRRVIVVDESSTHIGMIAQYARAPRGKRAYDSTLRNYGHNLTLIAGWRLTGMEAPMVIEGAVNTAVFEAYVRDVLCPTLQAGDVVIMDNLSSHKASVITALIESCGACIVWLPKYSPDFSPIEKAFSKLKQIIKRRKAQTLDELIEAITHALQLITETDACGWFTACGYLNLDQST